VSHDRYFLNRVISRLLYLRDGTCTSYPGNYADYQAHLAAPASAEPQAQSVKKSPQPPALQRPVARQPSRPVRRRKASVIEQEIGHIEAQLATVQAAIEAHDGAAWQRLMELSMQQGTLAARLEALMAEWEESLATEGG
jgi:ATP-binding cassette subfamily F protein 3